MEKQECSNESNENLNKGKSQGIKKKSKTVLCTVGTSHDSTANTW